MVLGPGKIIGTFCAVAAILIAFTIITRVQVSMRMQRTLGALNDAPNGGKDISYTIGHIGVSKANTVNVRVRYHYTVNGKSYEGFHLGLNGNSYGLYSEDKVEKIISELISLSQIPVWYDPIRPEFAVIIEPNVGEGWLWLLSTTFLSLLSFRYLDDVVLKLQGKSKAKETGGAVPNTRQT